MSGDGESGKGGSSFGKLRKALLSHAEARAGKWVSAAEEKVSDMTGRLTDVAEGGGPMLRTGARVLGGESPAKAAVSEGGKQIGNVADKAKDAVVDKAKDAVGAGGSGGGAGKAGDKKVTNIVEHVDIGLPLRRCYDHWTEFEEFSSFMKGVVDAKRSNDDEDVVSDWKLKVAWSNRSWKATVQQQVPDERIVWTSEGAKGSTQGVVSFHELAPRLTRVVVVVEYTPAGFFEKTGNIWRAQGRRLRLDLKHFQRYVTIGAEEPPEGWRGEIRDGEVVRSHEEVLAEDDQDAQGDGQEQDEDEYGDGEDSGSERRGQNGESGDRNGEFDDEGGEFDGEEGEGGEEEGEFDDRDQDAYDDRDDEEGDEEGDEYEGEDDGADEEEPPRARRQGRRTAR